MLHTQRDCLLQISLPFKERFAWYTKDQINARLPVQQRVITATARWI